VKKQFKPIFTSIMVLALGFSIAACGQNGTVKENTMRVKNDLNRVGERIVPNGTKTTDRKINAMNTRMYSIDPLKGAGQLENRAERVSGVKEATVVVHNKEAIVGLDIDNIGKKAIIEKQVYAALKGQYPAYNIHITSDGNMHQKLKSMNKNVTNGHPIKTLANDVAIMIRDISNAATAPLR
jgi:YhcN/YlaJ family sporulation lipoprotein